MVVWYLSKERNIAITSFNLSTKKDVTELWVTEFGGGSRKLATGQRAIDLEDTLLKMVWNNFPTIINAGDNKFGTNIDLNEEVEG